MKAVETAPAARLMSGLRKRSGATTPATACCTRWWCGERLHAGSVLAASPVSRKAWQRQPPKSFSFSEQDPQGSGSQSRPRYLRNSGDSCQI